MSEEITKKNSLAVSMIDPGMLQVIEESDMSEWAQDQFCAAGEEASKIKYFSQWILGKLADAFSKKWGDCSEYAREIHIEPRSLLAYRRVYRKMTKADPDFVPDGYLSWGALQMIAEQPDPVKLIEELTDNGSVTVSETYRHIKGKQGVIVPKKPHVSLRFNDEIGLWEVDISDGDFMRIHWEGEFGKKLFNLLRKVWES